MNLLLLSIVRINILLFLLSVVTPALTLSDEEKQWIEEHPIVKVGGGPDWAPFDFVTENKYNGIANDYLKILSEKTGLHFQVEIDIWKNNLQKTKEGRIDLLPAIYYSEERSKYLQFSKDYFSMLDYFFIRSDLEVETLNDLNGKIAAIPEDFAHEELLKKEFPLIKILTVKTFSDAIDAVLEKKADILFDTYAALTYILRKEAINTIIPFKSYRKNSDMKLYMATSHNNHTLINIIDKGLKEISRKDKKNIRNKWVYFNDEVLINYTLIYQILGVFLFFILGTWYWYRKLHYEVQKRKESEAQMSMLIENIPLNVIVSGFDGSVLRANAFALNTFNIAADDIYKYNVLSFYADTTERDEIIKTIELEGKVNKRIVTFRRLDKSEMNIMISIIPIVYDEGKALLSIMVDLTERIKMEEDLREAKESADSANKSKSVFLANMSHEIRTPMNAIIGFTELLNEEIQETRLKGYVKTIKSAGHTLLTLINDILDLSKIEAGKLELNKRATNIFDLSEDVLSIFMMSVRDKGLDLILDIDSTIPKSLLIDDIRLRQILVNIIGNAVKFTEKGFIKLKISAFNVDNHLSKLDLKIIVEDTGMGIAKNQLENIFYAFEQQSGQDNRQFGGTGLGLSISKRLVEMMDGKVEVASTKGKGSKFFVYLYGIDISSIQMLDEINMPEQIDVNIFRFKPAKLLVVDDIEDNRDLIVQNFENSALTIITANDGIEAIEQYKKEKPDIILMDIRMPRMDGYKAAAEIKLLNNSVPIIALTASIMKDEYERVKSENFDAYLRKPILRNEFYLALSHFLEYDKVEYKKEGNEEKKIKILFNDKTLLNKTQILNEMYRTLTPLHKRAEKSNNIEDIKIFTFKVHTLAKEYEIDFLVDYAGQLDEAIETFDIGQIQSLLRTYIKIQDQLELL